jgi:response regulator of citrate/malate metabolism
MPKLEKENRAKYILDDMTVKVVDTLLDNPSIPYSKSQLAEAAGISRDALYRRWDALIENDIVKKSNINSGGDYWELDQDSEKVEAIAKLLH